MNRWVNRYVESRLIRKEMMMECYTVLGSLVSDFQLY